MTITKCEETQKSTLFGNFPSDAAALERLHSVDPNASEGALCKADGDLYRAIPKRIDVTKPAGAADPRADLIFQILDKQNSILAARMGLAKNRAELAEALQTRNRLKDPKALKDTPTEKLLKSIAYSAVSFGVVTELFKDGAIAAYLGSLFLRGPEATNLIHAFEKFSEMKRLQVQDNLCGGLKMPGESGGELWKGLAGPLLIGAASVFGVIALNRALSGSAAGNAAASATSEPKPEASYGNADLQNLDLTQLREIDSALTGTLSLVSQQSQQVYAEARVVYRDIYAAYLGELKTRDLQEIKDEELRRVAQAVIAKGGGEPDASFFEKMGITELVGIGIGFGVGTGVMHRIYQNVVPWRDFLDRRMHRITQSARQDAAEQIKKLRDAKVLTPCEPAPESPPETSSRRSIDIETLKLGATALLLGIAAIACAPLRFSVTPATAGVPIYAHLGADSEI